ncbi:MAG: hypothetical protein NTX54_06550 [Chloroflexi bacterium]|nr:hypothetical protein [Chloroflexota bacterium]
MSSANDTAEPVVGTPTHRRTRRVSEERRWFLQTMRAQLLGARALAFLAMAVAIGSGAWWLVGTTGSPLVGVGFIALGVVLSGTLYWFIQLMYMIGAPR